LTTWEKFAKTKGIKNRKRSRMVFDETTQEWKARWGYKRIDDPKDNWVVEVPDRADPYQDYFEKQAEERKERVAKNEYKRLKNIARNEKGGRIKAPLPPPLTKDLSKHQLTQALGKAKVATASVGQFTKVLPDEPVPKRVKRVKVAPVVGDLAAERKKNLDILSSVTKKRAVLDAEKAANRQIAMEQRSKREKKVSEGEDRGPSKKRTKSQPKKRGKGKNTRKHKI
jgi:regulator of ribosome biosynthesis